MKRVQLEFYHWLAQRAVTSSQGYPPETLHRFLTPPHGRPSLPT